MMHHANKIVAQARDASSFPEREVTFNEMVAAFVKAGMPPDKAQRQARISQIMGSGVLTVVGGERLRLIDISTEGA